MSLFMKFFLSILFCTALFSQSLNISGIVISEKTSKPIIDANIILVDYSIGTITNEDGFFILKDIEKGKYNISISAIGFKSESVLINLDKNINNLSISLKEESIILETLDVVGRFPSKHIPDLTESILSDDLKNNQSKTISELFRNIIGVDVQMEHNTGRNVNLSIRGSSDYKPGGYNNRVLVLLDGFQISIPNSGSVDWNAMPLEFLDRVEVAKGPISSLYGQNSMGGVINLVTKKSEEEFSKIRFDIGNFNTRNMKVGFSKNNNDLSYLALFQHREGDGHRFNSEYKQNNIYFKAHSPKSNFVTSIMVNQSFNGQPGFYKPERPSLTSYRTSDRDSIYFQFFKRVNLLNNQDIDFSFSINHFYTYYEDREDTPESEKQHDTYYNDLSINLRAEYQWLINNKINFISGSDIILDQSDITIFNDIYDKPSQLTYGIFSRAQFKVSDKLLFSTGLRYDYRSINPGGEYNNIDFTAFSPKLNLTYTPTDFTRWNFALSKGFRAPSFSEMFLQYSTDYGLNHQGNPELKPEKLYGLDIGYNYDNLSSVRLSINTFYYLYDDMIDFVYALPVIAKNRTDISSSGIETNFHFDLNTEWKLNFGYTYLNVDDINNIDPILYRPEHKFISKIVYQRGNTNNMLVFNFRSEQDYQDFLSDNYEFVDNEIRFPIKKMDSLLLMDYIGTYQLKNVNISLKIANIFDIQYELIQDYPMPGRVVNVGFEKSF